LLQPKTGFYLAFFRSFPKPITVKGVKALQSSNKSVNPSNLYRMKSAATASQAPAILDTKVADYRVSVHDGETVLATATCFQASDAEVNAEVAQLHERASCMNAEGAILTVSITLL
jgi:hypothetical protein